MNFPVGLTSDTGRIFLTQDDLDLVDVTHPHSDVQLPKGSHVMSLGQVGKEYGFYHFEGCREFLLDKIDSVILEMSSEAIA